MFVVCYIFIRLNNMKSVLVEKSEDFAVGIIKFYQKLCDKRHYVIGKQILRSGTSIGANIAEAQFAQSRPDFVHKMSIALKEANETDYWLKILLKSDIISSEENESMHLPLSEITALLISSIKTTKSKIG